VLASGNKEAYNNLFNVVLKPEQGPQLMVIYGIGAAAIFFVLSLMYRYAYKRREDLKLSDKEVFDTKSSMQMNVIMGIVPVISMLIAGFRLGGPISFPLAGFAYWLYPIILLIYSRKRGRKRSQTFDIEKAHDDASEA
jgi:Na+/H+ antiporter NhaD/arsenite permease-like protein